MSGLITDVASKVSYLTYLPRRVKITVTVQSMQLIRIYLYSKEHVF